MFPLVMELAALLNNKVAVSEGDAQWLTKLLGWQAGLSGGSEDEGVRNAIKWGYRCLCSINDTVSLEIFTPKWPSCQIAQQTRKASPWCTYFPICTEENGNLPPPPPPLNNWKASEFGIYWGGECGNRSGVGRGGASLLVLSLRTESRDSCFRERVGGYWWRCQLKTNICRLRRCSQQLKLMRKVQWEVQGSLFPRG